MKIHPCIRLAVVANLLWLPSCATPTGDWYEDSIGFEPRLADQRIGAIRRELASEQNSLAGEEIRRVTLRRQVEASRRSQSDNSARLAEVNGDIARAKSELNDVEKQLASSPPESEETTLLRQQQAKLQAEIRQLSRIATSLLQP